MKLSKLRSISKKRILISGSVVAVALAVVIGATGAFFSDEESSIGNIFTAGAIDLKIDNESYAVDCTIPGLETCTGNLAFSTSTSWTLTDLTDEKFFNFFDLKPGDYGEDTISIHVDNDAWLCMDWTIDDRGENGLNEPEEEDGDVTENEGELQNFINFVWWVDDGDNVLEEDEDPSAIFSGTLEEMDGLSVALADSSDDSVFPGPIPGSTDPEEASYIGKAWCFGDLTLNALPQDSEDGPLIRGTGILCDGSEVDNTPQTDSVVGDLTFRAVQARNNPDFTCVPDENGPITQLTLIKEVIDIPEQDPDEDPSAWELSASGPTPFSGPGPSVGQEVDPGTYDLSESVVPGYTASAWVCVGGTQDDDDDTVTLEEGDDVTCTITNTEDEVLPGNIIVQKLAEAEGGNETDFEFDPSYSGTFFLSNGDTDDFGPLAPGIYSVDEINIPEGWVLDNVFCDDDDGSNPLSIELDPGETVTCTFENIPEQILEVEGP